MNFDSRIKELQEIIDTSNHIVFFGGAGTSTESGIPDFRSADGIYSDNNEYPPEEILSHSFFLRHTDLFYDFYRSKMLFPNAQPNIAHSTLSLWEQMGKHINIITQNIDGLHQKALSKNVIELHGSVERNYCMSCHKEYSLEYILQSVGIPKCTCGHIIKPDVVLYEEALDSKNIDQAISNISHADTLIVAGTSLSVYPAASFINYFKGKHIIVINKSSLPLNYSNALVFQEGIGQVFQHILPNTKEQANKI